MIRKQTCLRGDEFDNRGADTGNVAVQWESAIDTVGSPE